MRAPKRLPRWFKIAAAAVAAVLVGVIAFAAIQVGRLQGNIVSAPLNLNPDAPSAAPVDENHDPLQILILGTDTRAGKNGAYGSAADSTGSGNSDVMMLMNLSADRKRVTVVSFPRDLMVPIPACKNPATGKTSAPQAVGQLNSALSFGGPGCTVAAINKMTGLQVDHFMMADFNAVKELTSTLGGVDVCVNQPIDDPLSGLKLPAGVSSIQGEQALSFLRTRHGFGNGGDEGRIKAQQSFLASMTRKIKSNGTLTDVGKVLAIADTVTKNLTVDEGLNNVPALVSMANRLKDVDLSKVAFITAPVEPWDQDPNRLQLQPDASAKLFATLRADGDVTASAKPAPSAAASKPAASSGAAPASAAPAAPSTPAAPAAPAFDKAAVPFSFVNASGTAGRDTALSKIAASNGYTQAQAVPNDGPATISGTQLFYGPGYQEIAQETAKLYGIPAAQISPLAGFSGLELRIGQDFASGVKLNEGAGLPSGLNGQTAEQVTCQSGFGNY